MQYPLYEALCAPRLSLGALSLSVKHDRFERVAWLKDSGPVRRIYTSPANFFTFQTLCGSFTIRSANFHLLVGFALFVYALCPSSRDINASIKAV